MITFDVVYNRVKIWRGEMKQLPPIETRVQIEGYEYEVDKIIMDLKTGYIQVEVELIKKIK